MSKRLSNIPVGRAPKWCTPGEHSDVVLVKHVVLGKVKMEEFSETNTIPRNCKGLNDN